MSQISIGRTVMVQGRIVWVSGDLFKGKPKIDYNTKRPALDAQGQPKTEYGFGLAVPKSVLNQTGPGQPGEIWAAIHEEAFALYPSRQIPPSFAMKYKDGDGIDDKGVSFAQREGYKDHLVFACTTSLPIKFFKFENGQNFLVNDGIKCGDYVYVQLNIKAHPAIGQGKPGLYLNPMAVQLIQAGKEIINAPSGDQIFGVQGPPSYVGTVVAPAAPTGFIVPPASTPVAPSMPPGFAPPAGAPVAQPGFAPPQQAAPHYGVVPPQFQPPVAPPAMSAPAPYQQAVGMPAMPPAFPGYPQQ